jgi:hypothetical protein
MIKYLLIDSKYRDFTKYPNESKFTLNFEKIYKNIVSIRLISLELTNSINYISPVKNNNYINLHFPNILNDPIGIKLSINNIQIYNMDSILSEFNKLLNINLSSERYFYIFYLNNNTQISFDFDSILNSKLILFTGWYSIYGLNLIIQNYIQTNYNTRKSLNSKSFIPLDSGNFTINSFTLNIFDRRFEDNIRNDIFPDLTCNQNKLSDNIILFKNNLYSLYINDTINYIPNISGNGILDNLLDDQSSIYYINKTNTNPGTSNIMLYNLNFNYNNLKVSFANDFTNYYYTDDDWTTIIQFNESTITISDIPQFQIDFNNTSLKYLSFGYYLGYRLINNSFVLSPIINKTQLQLTAQKNYNILGEDYIFLKINDWGNFDFLNQILFSKIYLRSDLTTNNKTNNFINKEYIFRQLTTINRLDIELIDYLGNNVDLNGIDFSFTIALKTQIYI